MLEKTRAIACKYGSQVAVAAMTLPFALAASAQSTDPFDAAVSSATTKVTGYGAALVTFSAVAVVFMIGIKYIKKIPRAS